MEETDGFMGIGGKNSQQQNQSIGNLGNVFNFGLDQAKSLAGRAAGVSNSGTALTNSGVSNLGTAANYWKPLVQGNRPAMLQAVAPETNLVNQQADATRRQTAAAGTARGGGNAGADQQAHDAQMAQIDNLLFGARSTAAGQLGQLGGTETGLGINEQGVGASLDSIANNAAGTAGGAAGEAGAIATNARQQAAQEQSAAIKAVVGAIFG